MRVKLRGERVELPPEARSRIDRSLRLTLGSATADLATTHVALAPADAAAAGGEARTWRCRLRACPEDGEPIAVAAFGRDLDEAVRRATWRLARRLRRRGTAPDGAPAASSADVPRAGTARARRRG